MKSPSLVRETTPSDGSAGAAAAFRTWSVRLALAGFIVLGTTMAWTAFHFQNSDGSAFNPLRNFVSELGSEKHSRASEVFNRGLVFGSPLFFPLILVLGLRPDNRLGRAAIATGFFALLGSVGVGFASMDHLKPHLVAALLYFWSWLATALLFVIGFWRKYSFRSHFPLILAGLATLLASTAFLAVLTHELLGPLGAAFQNPNAFVRPAVWNIAVLEWCVVATFFPWIVTAILVVRLPQTVGENPSC